MSAGKMPAILVWMASSSGGACTPMNSVMTAPQSPPCATNFVYPRRFISTTQARAMWTGSQPVVVGFRNTRSPGSTESRHGRHPRPTAMRRRIGQRLDELHLLDDRAGPAMRDDDRQGILVLRTDVNEMDVESIDLGDEMRQRRSACASILRQS